MNIGDRVRFLHGTEEGIIRRIIDKKTVEVEIDDGFLIPVLKNEVVLIQSEESIYSRDPSESSSGSYGQKSDPGDAEDTGISVGITTQHNMYTAWIINDSNKILLFTISEVMSEGIKGLSHGVLNKYSYAKIGDWDLGKLYALPRILLDFIQFEEEAERHTPPVSKNINLQKKTIAREKRNLPLLNLPGIPIALVEEQQIPDSERIKEAMFSSDPESVEKDSPGDTGALEVDLHAEALIDDPGMLQSEEILHIQLDEFEKALEKAVINGNEEITFIHGIGNGILRNKIHKKLSQYPHIKYFEDAMKEKFGFGATKVYLK